MWKKLIDMLTPEELKLLGYLLLGLVVAIFLGFVTWFVFIRPALDRKAAVESHVTATTAVSHESAAADAAKTGSAAVLHNVEVQVRVKDARDAILSAPGASDPVNPDGNRVALRQLCRADAYAGDARCESLLGANP